MIRSKFLPFAALLMSATVGDTSGTDSTVPATVNPSKPKAKAVVYTTVKMDDGRTVDFAGKRKMLKTTEFADDGSIKIKLDFVNGEFRIFTLPEPLLAKFAAHGAEQKLGDEIAGLEDVDDCVLAIDELAERLNKFEWGIKREAGGMAGTSVLARAMAELSGKSMEEVKTYLATLTHAQKNALRSNVSLAPIIAKLEAAKAKKKAPVDTDSILGKFMDGAAPPVTGFADVGEVAETATVA